MNRPRIRHNARAARECERLDRIAERGIPTLTPINAPLRCPDLEAYWRDPAPFEAEVAENRRKLDAAIHAALAPARAKQAARWAAEEEA